ncbi:MAG TPA: hypothetical protein VIM53_02540 [Candidatus Saccharimonadales bacterium]
MSSLYIEARELRANVSLAWDLAHHMYTRQLSGKIVVVTESPPGMLAAVSKQWRVVMRQALRERSSTLKSARILELSEEIAQMERAHFAVQNGDDEPAADVLFATRGQVILNPPECGTMYVTQGASDEQLATLTSRMSPHTLVVVYAA